MNRRAVLIGTMASSCQCGPALAGWPTGSKDWRAGETDNRRLDPRLEGCAASEAEAVRLLSQVKVWDYHDDSVVDGLCDDLIGSCWRFLEVQADFAFFDDKAAPAAFATPALVLNRTGSTGRHHERYNGCVLFGLTLFDYWRRRSKTSLGAAVTFLMAHEHSHIRQYKVESRLSGPAAELHADFLGGWVLGRIAAKYDDSLKLSDALSPLRSGPGRLNDAIHGARALRVSAVSSGFDLSQRAHDVDAAFEAGLRHVGET